VSHLFSGDYSGAAFAHEAITVSNTAIGFTTATSVSGDFPASAAIVSVETDAIRYRIDGGNPVAAGAGHPVASGTTILITGQKNVQNFKAIRETTDATIRVTYLRG
jgi:hypothetical protein